MPISPRILNTANYMTIEQTGDNIWVLKVFNPVRSKKVPIKQHQVRTVVDARRIGLNFMKGYQIRRELIYHQIDEIQQYLGAKKKDLPIEELEQDIAEDTQDKNGDGNDDKADNAAPQVHGAGETILARKVSEPE